MKVLMFSTDRNIFKDGSSSRERMKDYGGLVEELRIVVYTATSDKRQATSIGKNVFVYPTSTRFRPSYFFDAYRISSSIIRNCLSSVALAEEEKLEIRNCVITCQDPFETGLVGYLIKRKFKLPLQIQIHTDFLSQYFWKESLKNKVRVILGKWLVRKADGIRVVSERIKDSLLSLYPKLYTLNPIVVLPIFADIEKIRNSPVKTNLRQKYPGRFIILMASRLTKEKNIGLAIEAMEEVVKKHPKALLLIVGGGPELGGLELQVAGYKLQDSVVFEPWIDDLPSYYKTADLFLLTSNYEGYGRTVIEATAAGLPVLMTDVGVSIGQIFPVGDKEALINSLGKLMSNGAEREHVLEKQIKVLCFYDSKKDYLNRLKQSWENCFS